MAPLMGIVSNSLTEKLKLEEGLKKVVASEGDWKGEVNGERWDKVRWRDISERRHASLLTFHPDKCFV